MAPHPALSPEFVAASSNLRARLMEEAEVLGIPLDEAQAAIAILPCRFQDRYAFLNRLTGKWAYELEGAEYTLESGTQLFGSHTWPLVSRLFYALLQAHRRLSVSHSADLVRRLLDPKHHESAIAEFVPLTRLPREAQAVYETRTGRGRRTADWLIEHPLGTRPVLFDVKRRIADLIQSAEQFDQANRDHADTVPPPRHDARIMVRSVEQKLQDEDPDVRLQGAWIVSDLKQERREFQSAFDGLSASRVHFVVLGGWQPGVAVFARRPEDRQYILRIFQESEKEELLFDRVPAV